MPADSDPEGVVSYSKERSKAALASNRVESNVGNGVFDGSISSGIPYNQARQHRTVRLQFFENPIEVLSRLF
ncbi:MAG: hypothetical protein CM1200mP36_07740 [Gammaproteobacteria bacterium]|nr:MAG: hypothetical protein CM1200mP36_07740 [Gammaproteobacteria bacterium]